MSGREDVMQALFSLVSADSVYGWKTKSRRLKLWGDVPLDLRPAIFQFEGGQNPYRWTQEVAVKRMLMVKIFIYTNTKDHAVVGSIEINNILDAIDTALKPAGTDIQAQRQTLGRRVTYCRIEGDVFTDPGDLDGDGMIIIPIRILLP